MKEFGVKGNIFTQFRPSTEELIEIFETPDGRAQILATYDLEGLTMTSGEVLIGRQCL